MVLQMAMLGNDKVCALLLGRLDKPAANRWVQKVFRVSWPLILLITSNHPRSVAGDAIGLLL